MGVLLEVKNLGISFGGLRAVDGLNMTINEGALVGLIGPNGAGKTTAFNMLTGVSRPTDGTNLLDGFRVRLRNDEGNAVLRLTVLIHRLCFPEVGVAKSAYTGYYFCRIDILCHNKNSFIL